MTMITATWRINCSKQHVEKLVENRFKHKNCVAKRGTFILRHLSWSRGVLESAESLGLVNFCWRITFLSGYRKYSGATVEQVGRLTSYL